MRPSAHGRPDQGAGPSGAGYPGPERSGGGRHASGEYNQVARRDRTDYTPRRGADDETGRHGTPTGQQSGSQQSGGQHSGAIAGGQRSGPIAGGQHSGAIAGGQRSGPIPGGRAGARAVRPGARPQDDGPRGGATGDAGRRGEAGNTDPGDPGQQRNPGAPDPQGAARASAAVVPPVVPGREGARTPAVPGRAGAMADSPSGVIKRPRGETTGSLAGRIPVKRPGETTGALSGRVPPIVPPRTPGQDAQPRERNPQPRDRDLDPPNRGQAPQGRGQRPPAAGQPPRGQGRVQPVRPPVGQTSPGVAAYSAATAVPPGHTATGDAAPPQGGPVHPSGPRAGAPAPNQVANFRAAPGAPAPSHAAPDRTAPPSGAAAAAPVRPAPGHDRPGDVSQRLPGRPSEAAGPGEADHGPLGRAVPPGRGTGAVPQQARLSGAAQVGGAQVGAAPVPSPPEDRPAPARAVRGAADVVPGTTGEPEGQSRSGPVGEWRAKLRSQRRLRVIVLVSLSVLVLGLLPLFFGVRAATRDPVFTSLDALDVPGWAAQRVDDKSSGSRWCFLDCRFRERTAQSQRPFEETTKAYGDALTAAGWQPWQVTSCPEQPITDGRYSCWKRDEFTLDLWVRLPECAVDVVAQQDPAALPSTGPDGVVPTAKPEDCVGSTVSIKVQNAITDQRGKPQPQPDPSLIGETPDPFLSDDPLLDPTPSPS